MNNKRFIFLFLSVVNILFCFGQGQSHTSSKARHHHFYHKIDVGFGNLYSCALASCLTGGINYLLDDAVFETSFRYPMYKYPDVTSYSLTRSNVLGLYKSDLISDFSGGIKLGYQTYNPDLLNWGVYGSAHYNNNIGLNSGEWETIAYGIASVGGGMCFTLGQMSQGVRWTFDVSLEYGKNVLSDMTECNGFRSQYSVGISGPGLVQNTKLFADIVHFPVISSPFEVFPASVGISWTITPQQVESKTW